MKPPVSLIDFNTTVPKTRPQRMFAIMTHNDIMTPRHFLLDLFLDPLNPASPLTYYNEIKNIAKRLLTLDLIV